MDEAEHLADRVGIVDNGRMVIEGSPTKLVAQLGADVIALQGEGDLSPLVEALQQEPYISHVTRSRPLNAEATAERQTVQIGVDQGDQRLVSVLNIAAANGFQVQSVTVTRPTLGQVFLAHTGYALRDQ
jgi:ABC-2 type transport system ATP-binding protein